MTQERWVPAKQVKHEYLLKKQKQKSGEDLLLSSVFAALKHIEHGMPASSSAGPAVVFDKDVDDEVGWCHRSVLIDSRAS